MLLLFNLSRIQEIALLGHRVISTSTTMNALIKAPLSFAACLCLASCQSPNSTDSGQSRNLVTPASAKSQNSGTKTDDVLPVIPQSFTKIGDALVIVVPDPESTQQALDARNEWAKTFHAAFEKRASFGSVTLAQVDTSNTVQRVVSVSANACILFLFDLPNKPASESTWMFMKHNWIAEMQALNGGPPALWGKFDNLKVPFGRKADLLMWIERVEFLAKLPSFNHALAFSVIQQKPKKTGRYRVFQSLPGYSLCDKGLGSGELFCVEDFGRPFVADDTWFDDKTLIWCGTFTYDTRAGATRTVDRYAQDFSTAITTFLQQTESRR